MDRVDHIKQVGDKLNKVGCGFCPMKWLHETLYLHTGDNHSCYHPKPQHIPLEEIEKEIYARIQKSKSGLDANTQNSPSANGAQDKSPKQAFSSPSIPSPRPATPPLAKA